MDISEKIKALRKERGLTLEAVGDVVGVGKSTVRKWENGDIKNMRRDKIALLAQALGVAPGYLMGWDDSAAPDNNIIPVDSITYIPVVGAIRCGPNGFAMQDVEGYVPAANVKHPTDCFYLRVTGDSMAPRIIDGDIALVRRQDDVDSGDLAAVVVGDEEGMLKKVIKQPDTIILQSFNPAYAPRVFTGPDMASVHIQGKVLRTEAQWAPQW